MRLSQFVITYPTAHLRPANPKGFALAFTENTDVIQANSA